MINNRGEAIDFLIDRFPEDEISIVTEINMWVGGQQSKKVWQFDAVGTDFGSAEGVMRWLVEDQEVVVTHMGGPSFSTSYKEGLERKDNLDRAASDQRLIEIVNNVTAKQEVDYDQVGVVLDNLKKDYSLKPIDIVRAYQICEARQEIARLEEAVYGEA